MRLRLALLNASASPHTPRNFRRELDADLVEFDADGGDLPADLEFDGAVITGSRASVYRDEAWIADLRAWTRRADEAGLPLLGVCFGHQLVADALGGEVAAMDEYEIGYREVGHRGGRLFDGVPGRFTVFTTHSDEVVRPPPGATVLAENDRSLQGFRRGTAFGVQFHPEYDRETAAAVTRNKEGELSAERRAAVLEGVTEESARAAGRAKALFDNFEAVCRDVSR